MISQISQYRIYFPFLVYKKASLFLYTLRYDNFWLWCILSPISLIFILLQIQLISCIWLLCCQPLGLKSTLKLCSCPLVRFMMMIWMFPYCLTWPWGSPHFLCFRFTDSEYYVLLYNFCVHRMSLLYSMTIFTVISFSPLMSFLK